MKIRPFTPADADNISRLIIQNLQQVLINDYRQEAIEALLPFFTPAELIKDSHRQFMIVGLLGNDLVGVASLDNDHVRNVFVDPARHKSGIGKRLMTALEAQARQQQLTRLYLMAAVSAAGFYEKLGYRIVKRFSRDLNGMPIAEIEMEKLL